METRHIDAVEDAVQPLINELEDYLKAVVLFGSATRKDDVTGSDIDLLLILDDTKEGFDEAVYDRANALVQEITNTAELDLHIQDPKPLSAWWDLLISGEPWAVTAMNDAEILYDPAGYVQATKALLQEGEMHGTNQRAQQLLERSNMRVSKVQRALLEEVTAELLRAMTEAAQAVLMYHGQPPPSPAKIGERLEEEFEDDLLPSAVIDRYAAFYEFTERVDHRTVTDITGRQLERYLNDAVVFVQAMMDLFDELEQRKQESLVEEAHRDMIDLCREVLEAHGVEVPEGDEAVLDLFHDQFVEPGIVSESHWELIQKIEGRREKLDEEGLAAMTEEDIYSSQVNLREFESAMERTLKREHRPSFLQDVDFADEGTTSVVEDDVDAFIDEFSEQIKAIWTLNEEVEGRQVVTLVILYNDLEAGDHSREKVRDAVHDLCTHIENNIGEEVQPLLYDLTDYWTLVRHGSPITFSEIRDGEPVYDPAGFFTPLKRLLLSGRIPGTKEAMRSLIETAPKRVMRIKRKELAHFTEQLFSAVVDAGQAALLVQGIAPPVQKQLPDELRTHLVDEGLLTKQDVDRAENVITFWKDYEHGDIDRIEGADIEELLNDAITFIESAEEVLETADG